MLAGFVNEANGARDHNAIFHTANNVVQHGDSAVGVVDARLRGPVTGPVIVIFRLVNLAGHVEQVENVNRIDFVHRVEIKVLVDNEQADIIYIVYGGVNLVNVGKSVAVGVGQEVVVEA